MNILLVEDDYLQADQIEKILRENFSNIQLTRVSSEYEFRSVQEDIRKNSLDLVILDVMLRWTDPAPQMPPTPEDVSKEGFYRAGIRCWKLLRKAEETKGIPVILYTVLEASDLEEYSKLDWNTCYLSKSSDDSLVEKIKQLISSVYH